MYHMYVFGLWPLQYTVQFTYPNMVSELGFLLSLLSPSPSTAPTVPTTGAPPTCASLTHARLPLVVAPKPVCRPLESSSNQRRLVLRVPASSSFVAPRAGEQLSRSPVTRAAASTPLVAVALPPVDPDA
jgi:hypothetical protein